MARVTEAEVEARYPAVASLITSDSSPYITGASLIVDRLAGYSPAMGVSTLAEIEAALAAHLAVSSQREGRVLSASAGRVSWTTANAESTNYLDIAAMFDATGKLLSIVRGVVKGTVTLQAVDNVPELSRFYNPLE